MDDSDVRRLEAGRGLSRRDLVRSGVTTGVALAVGSLSAPPLRAQAESSPAKAAHMCEFEDASVKELQASMQIGRQTARSLAEAHLDRIRAVDGELHSIIEVNPEALDIADALDRERRERGQRGPLHGIPVVLKDNIATADRMETTAGSLALLGAKPPRDAFLVERLRAAGAVILGKTNLSEWANYRGAQSSSGWSARGGQCRNPYALDRSPCGSSSGSAVAVSANLAALAVGTETDGSIVCPSSICGVVGIKPTVGLVSRAGIVPIAHSQDTAGPMARTVADAAVLLSVLAGADPGDPATADAAANAVPDYTKFLDPHGLKGARIGVARARVTGSSPEADAVFAAALRELAGLGAELVDPTDIPHLGEYDDAERDVLAHEFKADIAAYLRDWVPTAAVRTLADLIAFNEKNRDAEMRFFGQERFIYAETRGPLTDPAYLKALETCRRLSRTEGLDAVFAAQRLDAIVAPTKGPAWVIDLVNGDHSFGGSSRPAAVSGYPSITVPAGSSFGLPVGITFMGRPWSEATLIRLAYAFERGTRHRQPPRMLPTAELQPG